MTKRDRRSRRTIVLAPNAEVAAPVMAGAGIRPLDLAAQPDLVQTAAASPDGAAIRIVHHPSPEAEVSGWVWAEPPNSGGRGRVGLWALGCGHCGATHCAHIDATLQQLDQVLSAAPTPETWQIAGAGTTAQLADRARRAAERHQQRRHSTPSASEEDLAAAVSRVGTLPPDTAIPFREADATAGAARRDGGRSFSLDFTCHRPRTDGTGAALAEANTATRDMIAGLRSALPGWGIQQTPYRDVALTSPALFDTPETWQQVRSACEIIRRHGGAVADSTQLSLRVGCGDYQNDPEAFSAALGLVHEHDDLLARLGQNPEHATYNPPLRGRWWPAVPPDGYSTMGEVLNLHNLARPAPATASPLAINFRTWAPSLDPARLQAQVALSVGIVEAASRPDDRRWGPPSLQGSHFSDRTARRSHDSARRFAERVLTDPDQAVQFAALYATTDWQPRPR